MKTPIPLFLMLIIMVLVTGCGNRVADFEQVNPEEKIVLKFSHVVSENTPKGVAAQRFANLVKERTNGKVEVQVFPNSTLYKDGEELDALQSGAVQIIAPTTSKLSAMYPQWQIFDLPYAFPDEKAVHKAMKGYIGENLFSGLEQNNLKALAFWYNGFKQITNSTRPLVYASDFKGLSFRVMIHSKVLQRQFEKIGAFPVEATFDDLYRVLESHIVDGQENTMSNIFSKNLYKVQPYLTISNHGYLGYVVLTNSAFWSNLPDDIRDVLESTMAEVTVWERELAITMNEEYLNKVSSSGLMHVHLQKEEEKKDWELLLKPIYSEFRDIIGAEMMDSLKEINGQI